MTHKCEYAELIGATAKWITDEDDGRVVCMFCSEPRETRPAVQKAPAKTVRKSA